MKNLLIYIVFISLLPFIIIILLGYLADKNFETANYPLTIELIGSGIIASIVSLTIFILQKRITSNLSRVKAENFFTRSLKEDLKEAFHRDAVGFNYLGDHWWVFDGSFINSIYDINERNKEYFWEHRNYIKDPLMNELENFYSLARTARVEGEKLDRFIWEGVKKETMKRGTNAQEDKYIFYFIRVKLFIIDEVDNSIPFIRDIAPDGQVYTLNEEAEKIYDVLKDDEDIRIYLKKINDFRADLINLQEKIRVLAFK